MRRLSILFAAAVAVLYAVAAVYAGPSGMALTVSEASPPQLLLPADPVEVHYVIDTPGVAKPTGTVYLRRDGQGGFTALPLQLGVSRSNGPHPDLHLVLPTRFLGGRRLFYYAQLRDPASGASITIPAHGAHAPQTAWIMRRPSVVRLGAHPFGHPEAAQAVVARAAAKDAGWDMPFRRGPNTFLVGRDRSIWLEDTFKNRMLIWRAGKSSKPVRSVPLPTEGRHDIGFEDVAFGPKGTLYVTRVQRGVPGIQLFRIYARTGKVLWKSSNRAPDLTANMPLRVGVDGALYGYVTGAGLATAGTPGYGWMPLATRAGKPIPAAQQLRGIVWGYEPVLAGRRFIAEPYLPTHARYLPREFRLGVINRYGHLLHAWRIVGRTAIGPLYLWPQLLNGSIVTDLAPAAGPGKLEHLFLRIGRTGLEAKASLPFRIWGDYEFTDVRVGPEGKIYALATSPRAGIVIRRYALGP